MKTIVETQGLNLKPKMAIALGKNPPIQSNLLKGIDNYFDLWYKMLEAPVQQRLLKKLPILKNNTKM